MFDTTALIEVLFYHPRDETSSNETGSFWYVTPVFISFNRTGSELIWTSFSWLSISRLFVLVRRSGRQEERQ